jgi:hypothetical protein
MIKCLEEQVILQVAAVLAYLQRIAEELADIAGENRLYDYDQNSENEDNEDSSSRNQGRDYYYHVSMDNDDDDDDRSNFQSNCKEQQEKNHCNDDNNSDYLPFHQTTGPMVPEDPSNQDLQGYNQNEIPMTVKGVAPMIVKSVNRIQITLFGKKLKLWSFSLEPTLQKISYL